MPLVRVQTRDAVSTASPILLGLLSIKEEAECTPWNGIPDNIFECFIFHVKVFPKIFLTNNPILVPGDCLMLGLK
jgi:hypothetical protein